MSFRPQIVVSQRQKLLSVGPTTRLKRGIFAGSAFRDVRIEVGGCRRCLKSIGDSRQDGIAFLTHSPDASTFNASLGKSCASFKQEPRFGLAWRRTPALPRAQFYLLLLSRIARCEGLRMQLVYSVNTNSVAVQTRPDRCASILTVAYVS